VRFQPKTEKEVAEAGLLAKGVYDFEVTEATEKQSKAGNDMVELIVAVYDAEGRSRKIFDWLVDSEGSAYKIRHFAEAAGLLPQYEKGDLPAHAMIGRTGRCQVIIKKDKTGEYPDKNAIADYVSGGASKPAAAPADTTPALVDDEIPF
jgi:hypothetical protein